MYRNAGCGTRCVSLRLHRLYSKQKKNGMPGLMACYFFSQRGMNSGRRKNAVGERRERRAGGDFGAVRRDLGGRDRKSRGCAGRSTPGAKQTWSRTHQESGVIFAVPGFSCPLRLSLSHCGNGHRPPCVPASHGRGFPHASAYQHQPLSCSL